MIFDPKAIKELVLDDMRQGIKKVISGEIESYSNDFVSCNEIIKYVESIGGEDTQEFNSNGWQWDFWAYVNINNERYCVSGCGYYGGVQFSKSDEE